MIAASALMVTPSHRLVKRISVLVHIVGETSWPPAFGAGMTAAAVLVFFQLIHHVTFLYSLLNFVVPVSHFYTPCRVGWLGQWDTVGQRMDARFYQIYSVSL